MDRNQPPKIDKPMGKMFTCVCWWNLRLLKAVDSHDKTVRLSQQAVKPWHYFIRLPNTEQEWVPPLS